MIEYLKLIFPEYIYRQDYTMLITSSLIGIEREANDKPMGLRGIMLVSLGTTLFAIIALTIQPLFGVDMARLLYAPIVGIGFLGSGIIIEKKGHASGITTATVLWAMVAIGLLVGLAMFELAIGSTLAIYVILKCKTLEDNLK